MIKALTTALAASLLVASPMALVPLAAANVEIEAEGPVIELSVYESITAEPDLVTIGAGVSSEAVSAVEAMRINAAAMQRVIDRLRSLGVPDKDIQTTGINLNARYDYDRTNQRQVFRGYQVSNRVSVKLREIEETGGALDALVEAGATDLSGPSFSIEDDEAAKDAARESAIERAKARALRYAQMHGFDGVRVLAISETLQGRSSMPDMALRSVAVAEAASPTPVQPGVVSTGVSLSVKYEMVDDEAEEEAEDDQ